MEIDERILVRLTEKAAKISPEDKNEIYHKIVILMQDAEYNNARSAAQKILQLLQTELENRISTLAGDLMNPKSSIPKKAVFRRVDDKLKDDDPIKVETGIGIQSGLIILENK